MKKLAALFEKHGVSGGLASAALAGFVVMGLAWAIQSVTGVESHDTVASASVLATEMTAEGVRELVREEIDEQQRIAGERRDAWLTIAPTVAATSVTQVQLVQQCQEDIDVMLLEVGFAVDATAFAESMCSMDSTWKYLNGEWSHEDWMWEQFRGLVIDHCALSEAINQRLQALHVALSESNAALLAQLNAASPWSAESITVPQVELDGISASFRTLVGQSPDYLGQSWGEFGVASAAGAIASSIVMGMTEPDSGDTDQSSMFPALAGLTTDLIVGEAVEAAISTSQSDLQRLIEEGVRTELDCLMSHQPGGQAWIGPMIDLCRQHQWMAADLLVAEHQVDRAWAYSVLSQHYQAILDARQAEGNEMAAGEQP